MPAVQRETEYYLQNIGKVTSVHFEWLLDTRHGADYFRRWHRDKRNSGGLMVHKSTHHFDLVNFWLGTEPDTVFGMGDLKFYGRANAEERGVFTPYTRTTGVEAAKDDPFAIDLTSNPVQKGLYWDGEKEDGYQRDQNVFGDGISIEDTMNVLVRYRNKAVMTYSLYAYAPWEGFNVAINGTGGRLELTVHENSYINAGAGSETEGAAKGVKLYHFPLHGEPRVVPVQHGEGGHGGGDKIMLEEIVGNATPRPGYGANHRDGALAILAQRHRADRLRHRPAPAVAAGGIAGMDRRAVGIDPVEPLLLHVPQRPLAQPVGHGAQHLDAQHGRPPSSTPDPRTRPCRRAWHRVRSAPARDCWTSVSFPPM